jgi:transcriptional regulator with XRE-family HTH domain
MFLEAMKTNKTFHGFLKTIGNHLAELRQKKGYSTIKEFAADYELPEIHYWRIEKGKANVTLKSLSKILKIHKISVQDFFCLVTSKKSII